MADPDSDTVVEPSTVAADEAPTSLQVPTTGVTLGGEQSGTGGSRELRTRGSAVILKREEAERVIAIMKVMAVVAVGALADQLLAEHPWGSELSGDASRQSA